MAVVKMALAAFRSGKRSIPFTAFCITVSSVLISFIFYLSVQIYKYGIFDSQGIDFLIYQTIFLVFFISSAVIIAGTAVFSFIISFAAVVISSLISAAKLSRMTVISVLKYQKKINIALRESLVSRFLSKLFGYKCKLSGQLYTNERGKNLTLLFGTVFAHKISYQR